MCTALILNVYCMSIRYVPYEYSICIPYNYSLCTYVYRKSTKCKPYEYSICIMRVLDVHYMYNVSIQCEPLGVRSYENVHVRYVIRTYMIAVTAANIVSPF